MPNYLERRHIVANAALADPNMAPERRCIGSYYAADLSSGQITNCYVGLAHTIMLFTQNKPLYGEWRLMPTLRQAHLVHTGGSSAAVADWLGLTYKEIDHIIGDSDRKEPTEAINRFMLTRALPALAPEAN